MSNRTSAAQQRHRSKPQQIGQTSPAAVARGDEARGQLVGDVPSPCAASMAALQLAQSETHDLITELERRLAAVLRGEETRGPTAGPDGESPLHAELNHRIAYAEGHNLRLHDLIDRLTV